MSEIVDIGLDAFMLAQATFTSQLPTDENGSKSFYSGRVRNTPDIFPKVVFFEAPGGGPDADTGYSSKMVHEFYHIQVWDEIDDLRRMKHIAKIIKDLLHEKKIPLGGSTLYYVEAVRGGVTTGFDEETKRHFYVQAFHLVHAPA